MTKKELEKENQYLRDKLDRFIELFSKNVTTFNEYLKALDATSMVAKMDKELNYIYFNELYSQITGFEYKKLIKKRFGDLFHPNMSISQKNEISESIKNKDIYRGTIQIKSKNGKKLFLDCSIVPILDDKEEVIEYIEISRDITSMIEKEKELEKLRAKEMSSNIKKAKKITLFELIEAIPMPCAICKKNGEVVFLNSELRMLFFGVDNSNMRNLKTLFKSKKPCCFLNKDDWISECAIFGDSEDYIAELDRDGHFDYKIKAKKLDDDYYVVILVALL